MDSKALEELRNKYIKNPPEGMTAKLVKSMSDSNLLDMHYFLTVMGAIFIRIPPTGGISYYIKNAVNLEIQDFQHIDRFLSDCCHEILSVFLTLSLLVLLYL